MASTVLNYIVGNYLSNFIEINPSQTQASLWSGEVQMSNVKIKKELFQTMNIPFLEVVHGYIGSIKIKMSMPMFYKYPIKVKIEKVFFHARQKDINEINKDEEIKNMEAYKLSTLENQEILKSQIDKIDKEESSGMQKDIINNLHIEINDVIFRYDDNVSYKKIPYSLGLILKKLSLSSTKSDFKLLSNPDEIVKAENDSTYKKINMMNLSMFWDCFENEEELKFNNLIENSYYNVLNNELKQYLDAQLDFYIYCLSEIYVHSKNSKAHQYILHNIQMDLDATLNENINKTLKPEYIGDLEFPIVVIDFSLKQIETILKVLSYMNLSSLYHEALAKDFYKKELSEEDKNLYIKEYVLYFHKKYDLQEKIDFPEKLRKMEEGLSLYQIQLMRAASLKKNKFFQEKTELEKKIKEEDGKFFFRNEKLIASLKNELQMLINSEDDYNQNQLDELENKDAKVEIDTLMNLPDSYLHYLGIFHMKKIKFVLYEDVSKKSSNWIYKGKIIEIEFINYFLQGEFFKKGMSIKMTLEDTMIRQEKIRNPNYSEIIFGDVNTKGKILDIEFIINPHLECSDMKFIMKAERGIYIICDLYVLQYIQYKVMKVLSTSINFEEIANYAKDSVGQYIQIEYAEKFLKGNYQHTNIYLDIVFNSPVIILPLNIFDNKNTNCIKLSLGKFKGFSKLPPRMKPEIDYSKKKDISLLFDIYEFDLQGGTMSTVEDCTLQNGFNGKDTMLLNHFDMSIICKILIETKNIYFSNIEIIINIPNFDFQIDEFQILFLIDYLGNMNKGNNKLSQETSNDTNQQNEEKEQIKKFIQNQTNENIDFEDENIKYLKKRVDEFDKKLKRKRTENRYNEFVKSYSIIMKKNKLLNNSDIIDNNKKTLYVLLEFNEVKFTIKKNFTDFTVEEYLVYYQKLLKIEYFIIDTGDMMVKLVINDIGLFDKDKEEKENNISDDEKNIINTDNIKKKLKKDLIHKKFSCLIKSSTEENEENKVNEINETERNQEGFIIITYLYRVKLEDTNINIIMNNLSIIISYDSLKRMYQFSMYYLDRYQKMVEETNILNSNPNNISPENKSEYIKEIKVQNKEKNKEVSLSNFTEGIKKDLKKQMDDYLNKIKTAKTDYVIEDPLIKWGKIIKKDKMVKKETIKNFMRVKFTMNNTIFKVPLYPKNSETPLVAFFFNMVYDQEWNNKYENIYTLPNKKILETNYIVQDSKMNLIVNKLNLDVNFPSSGMFVIKRKILNDLRIYIEVSMSIIPKFKQSLIITDILLEPLLINLTVKQFIYLMEFYNMSMKFLYYDMAEQYIPLMKPEYLIYGIPKRKKKTFKECIKRIVISKKLHKKMKKDLKTLKKKGEKIENVNTSNFGSYVECNVKIDQIVFTFFDTNDFRRMSLFNADFSNLFVKFLSNSKVKDKKNMGNAIVEMMTASELPIEEYNIDNLGMYLDVICNFEANYHNTTLSEYEPLIERIKVKVLMYQVASFMRTKCFVNIDEMINFNISSNAVKALNLFMYKYSEESEEMENFKDKLKQKNMKSSKNVLELKKKRPFRPMRSQALVANNEGAVISVFNHTGLEVSFSFESNPHYIIGMKPGELMAFSKADLKNARGLDERGMSTNMNTIRVSIMRSGIIKGINFNHNNTTQYKLRIKKNESEYTIYFNVKVKTQGVIKKIIFSSSLSIYNDTIYDSIFIMINDETIPRNIIEIPKNRRRYIPISWFLSETPKSEIRIQLSQEGESYFVFYHISEIISEPIDKKTKDENLKKKSKFVKKYENTKNLEKKDIIDKIKKDSENLLKSKIVTIENEECSENEKNKKNKKKYLCFDYYIYQSKGVSKLLNSEDEYFDSSLNNKNSIKRSNTNATERQNLNSSEFEFSYEFFVYVRPCMTFINMLPFNLNLSINDFNKFQLEKNVSENIYYINPEDLKNNALSLKLILEYYEKKYKSDYNIPESDIGEIELFEEQNDFGERKYFNLVKLPKDIELDQDIKFTLILKGYSCLSYNIIFYCDYIVNNRLPYTLWCIPCDKKGIKKNEIIITREKILPNNKLSLINLSNNEDKFVIRSEDSQWSKTFDINTIGVNGAVTIDEQVKTIHSNKSTKSKDIACLISKSQKYNKSIVIIFEQRFLLYNNLGFDIYYKQENDVEILLNDKSEKELFYNDKKKTYRLGLFNSDLKLFNYSQPFSAENVSDIDLSIKIGQKDLHKYRKFKNNIFTNNNKDYYLLIRIINKSYDEGTFYLLIFLPLFPFLEIVNETNTQIKIYETNDTKNPLVIEPYLKERKKFPYLWKNTIEPKDNLYFELYGFKQIFSFSKLEKEIITINEKNSKEISKDPKHIQFHVFRKNKGQTRVIEILEIYEYKKHQKKFESHLYLLKRKRPISSSYKVYLKGIGFSIINEEPKELFYISFYDLKVNYLSNFFKMNYGTKTETTENIELYIKNFQIDYCLNDSFKNIIFPSSQMIPSIESELEVNNEQNKIEDFVPFLSMLVTRQYFKDEKKTEEISFYKQIDLVMQEFNIKVEQYALTCLLELVNEIMGFFDYATKLAEKKKEEEEVEEILETKIDIPLEKLFKENEDLERMTINILMIGCLKFNITIRLDLSSLNISVLPKPIMRLLGSVGNTLTRITDGQLKFSEKIITNIYKNTTDIMWDLINQYSKEGIKQIYKILGSTDIIGNPVNFIEGLGTGFFELVNEPRKGFLLGPKQFGKGLLKGLGGVLSGVVGGSFGVVQRISGSLYSATQSLTGKGREYIMEEEDEPTNIITGIGKGLYGGLKELASGITGIFTHPYRKYKKKKTAKSLISGIFSGLFGLIISPFSAALKLIYSVSTGAKNTITTISGKKLLKSTRFRHPRVMLGGDEAIHYYETNLAEAKELLWRIEKLETDSIFYAEYFVSGDKGFNSFIKENIQKMCMVIITDKYVFVIYNSSKVIFKLEIKKIHNCSIHLKDNKYILAFRLDDGHIKGFRLEQNYARIACQIYDMFGKIDLGKKIKAVYTIKAPAGMYSANKKDDKKDEKEQIIIKNEPEEEKIDQSSYAKTLVDNDSVITFDDNNDNKDANILNDIEIYNNGMNKLKNKKQEYNIITTNDNIQSKSSRNGMITKNEDIYLDVKNFK